MSTRDSTSKEADVGFLTTAQVAALLGVRVETVRRWRANGQLRAALRLPGGVGESVAGSTL